MKKTSFFNAYLRFVCNRWCVDLKSVEFDFVACGVVFPGHCAGRPNRVVANEFPASEQERMTMRRAVTSFHLFQYISAFC